MSEFQTVIMPVVRGYAKMLRRNLLYTGITRAKNFLILCGEAEVLAHGLSKTDDLARLTSLRARLNPREAEEQSTHVEAVKEEKGPLIEEGKTAQAQPKILNAETAPHIHPMIGMKDVSPYDFMEERRG